MQFNHRPAAAFAVVALGVLAAACADVPTQPAELAPVGPAFAVSSATSCASTGAVVVSTEAQLVSAVAAAQAGDVVAINGMITLANSGDGIRIPEGVTVTCATPGAGVRTNPGSRYALFLVYTPNVTVSGLVLDGFNTGWPMVIQNGVARSDVANVTFTGNTTTCGFQGCLFIIGASKTTVAASAFEAKRNGSGVHIQQGLYFAPGATGLVLRTDGTLVENNTLTAIVPSGSVFGAIRPRDGTDIVVRGNTILGPWINGIAMVEIREGLFERNSIEGARRGIAVAGPLTGPPTIRNSLFRFNEISTTVGAAVTMQRACNNVFLGNRLTTPAAVPNMVFAASTGANVVLGPAVTVADAGNYDCNGDGTADPNSWKGSPHKGGHVGETMSEVMPNAGRM